MLKFQQNRKKPEVIRFYLLYLAQVLEQEFAFWSRVEGRVNSFETTLLMHIFYYCVLRQNSPV